MGERPQAAYSASGQLGSCRWRPERADIVNMRLGPVVTSGPGKPWTSIRNADQDHHTA